MRQIKFPEQLDFETLPMPKEFRNALARPNAAIETDDIVFCLQAIERKIGVDDSTDTSSLDYRIKTIEEQIAALSLTEVRSGKDTVTAGTNNIIFSSPLTSGDYVVTWALFNVSNKLSSATPDPSTFTKNGFSITCLEVGTLHWKVELPK